MEMIEVKICLPKISVGCREHFVIIDNRSQNWRKTSHRAVFSARYSLVHILAKAPHQESNKIQYRPPAAGCHDFLGGMPALASNFDLKLNA